MTKMNWLEYAYHGPRNAMAWKMVVRPPDPRIKFQAQVLNFLHPRDDIGN